jgi:general stress protein 26
VLAVETADGSPHAATVHFAHAEDPFAFYFETHSESRKGGALLAKEEVRASLVVGSNENDLRTLQLDGTLSILSADQRALFDGVYLGKFPEKTEKLTDPKFLTLTFVPQWWRFTDWTAPQGKIILTSDDK